MIEPKDLEKLSKWVEVNMYKYAKTIMIINLLKQEIEKVQEIKKAKDAMERDLFDKGYIHILNKTKLVEKNVVSLRILTNIKDCVLDVNRMMFLLRVRPASKHLLAY